MQAQAHFCGFLTLSPDFHEEEAIFAKYYFLPK